MKWVIFLAAIFASLNDLAACSCFITPNIEQAYLQSDLVFEGKVESIFSGKAIDPVDMLNNPDSWRDSVQVAFRIKRVFRGQAANTVHIGTGKGEGDCGLNFITGVSYLVFANKRSDGHFYTGRCQATGRLPDNGKDPLLDLLVKYDEPNQEALNAQRHIFIQMLIGASVLAFILGMAAYPISRRLLVRLRSDGAQ